MIAELAGWVSIILFIAGIILSFLEIVIPGFGIFAISGIGCIVASIFLVTPDLFTAVKCLAAVLFLFLILTPIILKMFSKTKSAKKLLMEDTLSTEKGYVSGDNSLKRFVGEKGTALTILRPSGKAVLNDGSKVDVMAKGEFISQGEKIKVISMEGTWLVVSKYNETDKTEP